MTVSELIEVRGATVGPPFAVIPQAVKEHSNGLLH
jgi:hypothetical protein